MLLHLQCLFPHYWYSSDPVQFSKNTFQILHYVMDSAIVLHILECTVNTQCEGNGQFYETFTLRIKFKGTFRKTIYIFFSCSYKAILWSKVSGTQVTMKLTAEWNLKEE